MFLGQDVETPGLRRISQQQTGKGRDVYPFFQLFVFFRAMSAGISIWSQRWISTALTTLMFFYFSSGLSGHLLGTQPVYSFQLSSKYSSCHLVVIDQRLRTLIPFQALSRQLFPDRRNRPNTTGSDFPMSFPVYSLEDLLNLGSIFLSSEKQMLISQVVNLLLVYH